MIPALFGAVLGSAKPTLLWEPTTRPPSFVSDAYAVNGSESPSAVVASVGPESENDLDTFVPVLSRRIRDLRRRYPDAKVFLLAKPEEARIDLVRQAIREAGGSLLHPAMDCVSGRASLDLGIYSALVADRASHEPWRIVSFSSQEVAEGPASMAVDGDPQTYWHTQYSGQVSKPPHEVVVDLGKIQSIGGFSYLPRQDGGSNGVPKTASFAWSLDGQAWLGSVGGEVKSATDRSYFCLGKPIQLRYFKFTIQTTLNGEPYGSAAELGTLPAEISQG